MYKYCGGYVFSVDLNVINPKELTITAEVCENVFDDNIFLLPETRRCVVN